MSIKTGLVTFLGLFNEAPLATKRVPVAHVFCHPLERSLNSAMQKRRRSSNRPPGMDSVLFETGSSWVGLLNTKRLLVARHSNKKTLLHWTIPDVSPVVVSSRVAGWDLPPSPGEMSNQKGRESPSRQTLKLQAWHLLQFVKAMGILQLVKAKPRGKHL